MTLELAAPPEGGIALCKGKLALHSQSFHLASLLLGSTARRRAAVLYAFCRRLDDAVDECPPALQARALEQLQREVAAAYSSVRLHGPELAAFQALVREVRLPREYVSELVAGMKMDVEGHVYRTFDDLLLYCHRVAGVVGLMMCHALGVREDAALRRAAHLGIAMQLTNICRDVLEDWQRGRLYLPDEVLAAAGAPLLRCELGAPLAREHEPALARALDHVLARADAFYASADAGLWALPVRSGFAVRAARLIYSAIGARLREQRLSVFAGRAVVPRFRKLRLVLRAALASVSRLPGLLLSRSVPRAPELTARFPDDILPL